MKLYRVYEVSDHERASVFLIPARDEEQAKMRWELIVGRQPAYGEAFAEVVAAVAGAVTARDADRLMQIVKHADYLKEYLNS